MDAPRSRCELCKLLRRRGCGETATVFRGRDPVLGAPEVPNADPPEGFEG